MEPQQIVSLARIHQVPTDILAEARYNIATQLASKGAIARAAALLDNVLEDIPDHCPARLARAKLLVTKHPAKAMQDLNICIQHEFMLQEALGYRARAAAALGRIKEDASMRKREKDWSSPDDDICVKKRKDNDGLMV
jgi:hypothetical protein